jgi:hypothetical protein
LRHRAAIVSGGFGAKIPVLFSQLGLSAELLRAIDEKGYQRATPIQQQAIPLILEGRDVLAGAAFSSAPPIGVVFVRSC